MALGFTPRMSEDVAERRNGGRKVEEVWGGREERGVWEEGSGREGKGREGERRVVCVCVKGGERKGRIRNSVELTCKEKPYRKALSPSPSFLSVLFFRSQEFVQPIVNALVCLMSSAKCRD